MLGRKGLLGRGRYGAARQLDSTLIALLTIAIEAMHGVLLAALAVIKVVGPLVVAASWQVRERIAGLGGVMDPADPDTSFDQYEPAPVVYATAVRLVPAAKGETRV